MVYGDISFVMLAVLYGVLSSLGFVALAYLRANPHPWRVFPFFCITLFFIFLTQHPFPAPGTLSCPISTAAPQLESLRFTGTLERLGRRADPALMDYLGNRMLVASAMNFLICTGIGLMLVRHVMAWRWIALFGVGLTLAVELTQLTGIWGLYSCAYRQFDVDDLLLNTLGVICGAALAKTLGCQR